jgi:macrodomain Ter protein organizer (MatP/YcbG family)
LKGEEKKRTVHTTITVDWELWRQVRLLAEEKDLEISEVLEQILREYFSSKIKKNVDV